MNEGKNGGKARLLARRQDDARLHALLDGDLSGRRATVIRFSRFQPCNRDATRLRRILDLIQAADGTVQGFLLASRDMVLVHDGGQTEMIADQLKRIAGLFPYDPCCLDGTVDRERGCLVEFDLPAGRDGLIGLIGAADDAGPKGDAPPPPAGEAARRPLDPGILATLDKALANADLSTFLRKAPIYSTAGGAVRAVGRELFVDVGRLTDSLASSVDLKAAPWLFHRLTERFDSRLLRHLAKSGDNLEEGLSLNLNVSSILGKEFLEFNQIRALGGNVPMALEFTFWDVLSDVEEYFFVRDFLHQNGYTVCIDNVGWESLPLVLSSRLGADTVKVIWNDRVPGLLKTPDGGRIAGQLADQRGMAVILSRCDSPDAFKHGLDMGVRLFQSRDMDAGQIAEALGLTPGG